MRSVAGEPLPAVLYTNDFATFRVLSETLQLRPDGSGSFSSVREAAPGHNAAVADGPQASTWEVRFRVADGRVEITSYCPPNANCAPPPHYVGSVIGGELRIDYMLGRAVSLVYERVADQ